MTGAIQLFKKAVNTLKNYVSENTSLSVIVNTTSYPVKISFIESSKQMSVFDDDNGSENAAELQFVFYDKMQIKTQEDFSVSEEVFNKLKSLSKEVNRLFQNAFFAKNSKMQENILKYLDECAGIKPIGNPATSWQGKEFFLAVVTPQEIVEWFWEHIRIEANEE